MEMKLPFLLSDEEGKTVFATPSKNFLGYKIQAIIAKVQPIR